MFGPEQKGQIPQRTIKLAIAIDTSGSVSNEDLQEFIAEMKSIQKCYRNETWILECDAEVQKKYLLRPYSKIDTKFKGRGGTAYEPIFNAIEKEQKLKPDLLVYFTDFHCSFPSTHPKYNVLWVVTTTGDKNNKAPWGGTIHMKKKKGSKKSEDE
jgi:predicted metal-dependent peptidase